MTKLVHASAPKQIAKLKEVRATDGGKPTTGVQKSRNFAREGGATHTTAQLPAFKRLIRQALDEPTLMSVDAALSTSDQGDGVQTITIDLPAANRMIGSEKDRLTFVLQR